MSTRGAKPTTNPNIETAAGLSGSDTTYRPPADAEQELHHPGTPQDVASARAKNQLKGKVTADKWNQ